ncbi:hypothetical protein [Streptococcus infantarius]|uniref:hypothetical protein n=1 Tax=Streptococcus infantarius TaxID=102684 RepID=UPI003C24D0B0
MELFLISVWILLTILLYSGLNVNLFIVLISSIVAFPSLYSSKKFIIDKKTFLVYIFLLYYFIITIIRSQNILGFLSKLVLLPLFIYYLVSQKNFRAERLIKWFQIIIWGCAVFGLIEYLLHFNVMVYFVKIDPVNWIKTMNVSDTYFPSSLFLHYTYYSYILLVGFILSISYPFRNIIVTRLFQLTLLVNLILCQARISWIAFFVLAIIELISKITVERVSRNKLLYFMLLLLLLFIFGYVFNIFSLFNNFISNRFSKLFVYGLNDGSLGQRIGTLGNWKNFLNNNPVSAIFGLGFGGVSNYLREYSYFSGYNTADSMITIFLVETGIFGFIIFVFGIISSFLRAIKGYKINDESSKFLTYLLIITLIFSLTIDFSGNLVILYVFYMLLFSQKNLKDNKE